MDIRNFIGLFIITLSFSYSAQAFEYDQTLAYEEEAFVEENLRIMEEGGIASDDKFSGVPHIRCKTICCDHAAKLIEGCYDKCKKNANWCE